MVRPLLDPIETPHPTPTPTPGKDGRRMPGETQLHKTLKKEACRWMFRQGYRTIAAEVRLPPVGIVDAVGTGYFPAVPQLPLGPGHAPDHLLRRVQGQPRRLHPRQGPRWAAHVLPRQQEARPAAARPPGGAQGEGAGGTSASSGTCLLCPLANLHYVLAPAGLLKKSDLPPRWGLLTLGEGGVQVSVRADWVEAGRIGYVESAVARTLTGDIYRADSRAIGSVNREIAQQQAQLAERLRALTPALLEQAEGSAELARPIAEQVETPPAAGMYRPRSTQRKRRPARR